MPDSQPWIVRQHSSGADEHCIITAAQNMRHAAGRFGRDPSRSTSNIGDESIQSLRPFQSHERHTRAMKMEEALVDLFCLLAKYADPHMNAGVPQSAKALSRHERIGVGACNDDACDA